MKIHSHLACVGIVSLLLVIGSELAPDVSASTGFLIRASAHAAGRGHSHANAGGHAGAGRHASAGKSANSRRTSSRRTSFHRSQARRSTFAKRAHRPYPPDGSPRKSHLGSTTVLFSRRRHVPPAHPPADLLTARPRPGPVNSSLLAPLPPQLPGLGAQPQRSFIIPPRLESHYVRDEVLAWMALSTSQSVVQNAADRAGLTLLQSEDLTAIGLRLIRFRLLPGSTLATTSRILSRDAAFYGMGANYLYALVQQPNIASLPPTEAGDAAQYIIGKFHLSDVHRLSKGNNVTIAVIDSMIDSNHSDLKGVVADKFEVIDAKPDRHGTGMAGAIAAHHRLLGVAPSVRLLAIDAFTATKNSSAEGTSYNIMKGIDWAIRRNARVINMSFAGPHDALLQHGLRIAHDHGVVLIAAVGNAGAKSPPLFPSADPNVIAVTATDSQDRLFSMANRGAHVAVAAPGVDVLATAPQDSYEMSTGTSIAAAHVSGIVALMLERDPTLRPDEIRRILESTATDLGLKGRDTGFGWGLVNPQKALDAVAGRSRTLSPKDTGLH